MHWLLWVDAHLLYASRYHLPPEECVIAWFKGLVSCVGERPRWPQHNTNTKPQQRKKLKGQEEREIISNLLILDFNDGKL